MKIDNLLFKIERYFTKTVEAHIGFRFDKRPN